MCSRGVFQLKKLTVFFCDFGGSSNGVRELITSSQMKDFMKNNQQIEFEFICKRNHHPFIKGSYINGYTKNLPLRNFKQQQVFSSLNSLREHLGRKSFKVNGTRVFGAKKSIQGQWQPNLFNKYSVAELSKTHKIPQIPYQSIQKTQERQQIRDKDVVNQASGIRDTVDPHRVNHRPKK